MAMRTTTVVYVLGVWFLLVALEEASGENIVPVSRIGEYVNQVVTAEGVVAATRRDGHNTFLTLGSEAEPELIIALTPPLLWSGFPEEPEKFYQGKTVQVNGLVYVLDGQLGMVVSDADRIEVVAPTQAEPRPSQAEQAAPSSDKDHSPETETTARIPRELLIDPETTLLDLRSDPEGAVGGELASKETDGCTEAQTLWRQVSDDLVPHLRTYAACLEKGSFGCDPMGEKVALGMLGVQQAQKRVRAACH